MRRSNQWFCAQVVAAVLMVSILVTCCPAKTPLNYIIAIVDLVVWTPLGMWMFDQSLAAQDEESATVA